MMPLADLPLPVLFFLFLLIFVLIGLYPAWKKNLGRIREILKRLDPAHSITAGASNLPQAARPPRRQPPAGRLNSYEILVFRRLAQSANRGFTRKQLEAALHLQPANLKQTLQSLSQRGLIALAVTQLLSIRFYLSERGRSYAVEQDMLPQINKLK